MQPFLISYRGVAHPWLCDRLGHLNTRNYFAALDDSMQHFFAVLGCIADETHGWADVKHEINYLKEIPLGELFHVECALLRVGRKSISYRQQVVITKSSEIAATCDAITVWFDLEKRTAVEAPMILQENSMLYLIQE
jgi:acyl-CoA thioester hydrolase